MPACMGAFFVPLCITQLFCFFLIWLKLLLTLLDKPEGLLLWNVWICKRNRESYLTTKSVFGLKKKKKNELSLLLNVKQMNNYEQNYTTFFQKDMTLCYFFLKGNFTDLCWDICNSSVYVAYYYCEPCVLHDNNAYKVKKYIYPNSIPL